MGQLTGNVTESGMDLKSRIKRLPIVGQAVQWLRTHQPPAPHTVRPVQFIQLLGLSLCERRQLRRRIFRRVGKIQVWNNK